MQGVWNFVYCAVCIFGGATVLSPLVWHGVGALGIPQVPFLLTFYVVWLIGGVVHVHNRSKRLAMLRARDLILRGNFKVVRSLILEYPDIASHLQKDGRVEQCLRASLDSSKGTEAMCLLLSLRKPLMMASLSSLIDAAWSADILDPETLQVRRWTEEVEYLRTVAESADDLLSPLAQTTLRRLGLQESTT